MIEDINLIKYEIWKAKLWIEYNLVLKLVRFVKCFVIIFNAFYNIRRNIIYHICEKVPIKEKKKKKSHEYGHLYVYKNEESEIVRARERERAW